MFSASHFALDSALWVSKVVFFNHSQTRFIRLMRPFAYEDGEEEQHHTRENLQDEQDRQDKEN